MAIQVRVAQEHDIDFLVKYNTALAKETEGKILSEPTVRDGVLALLHRAKLGSYIVAEMTNASGRNLVGQVMITYEWSDWRNGVIWWIQSVYVDPAWRRQGIYRAMHHYILEQAKKEPEIRGIRLYVEHQNHTAQAVYQTVGLTNAGYLVYEMML